MNDRSVQPTRFGFASDLNWLLGGIVGGAVGALLFGGVLWAVDPDIITETVPAIYGLDPGAIGWVLHLAHGSVLGIIFGFVVTREFVLGTLAADVETGFIAAMGLGTRLALAGVVYGLVLWTALPLIGQTVWTAGGMGSPGFPYAAAESLIGHVAYGALLGLLFSLFVDVETDARGADAPFEEAPQGQSNPE